MHIQLTAVILSFMFEKCLYYNSNALARSVTRIWTAAYQQFDLSPPHAFLVRLVLTNPGISPRELAEKLTLSRSTVTRFLDSLEKKKFIKRKALGSDGREIQVFPLSRAKEIHAELNETRAFLMKKMETLFGEKEISKTVNNLRKTREKLDK
ncbi:MAG: MarR family winged helix-turn-helix transcriptional regulator [Gammaproteobacteria bacterium]